MTSPQPRAIPRATSIGRLLLAVLVLASSAVLPPASTGSASIRSASTAESVQVLMPFDGQWANDFSTAPWQHSRSSVEDWTMDIFGLGQDIFARFDRPTGELRLEIAAPIPYGCSNAGSMVWVEAWVDGSLVGRMGYHHMLDVAYPAGATITDVGSAGVLIGRTAGAPSQFGGGCWNVSTDLGVHVHVIADNASGRSCYVPRDKGTSPGADAAIAVLGGSAGASWGSGPRAECSAAALEVGNDLDEFSAPTTHGPFLVTSLDAVSTVNDFQIGHHPVTGASMIAWQQHRVSGDTDLDSSWVQPLAVDAQPLGEPVELTTSSGTPMLAQDVGALPASETGDWLVVGNAQVGGSFEQLLVYRLDAAGSLSKQSLDLDPGSVTFGGRFDIDHLSKTVVVVWTRIRAGGNQIVAARLSGTDGAVLSGPTVVFTAPTLAGFGVEDVVVDQTTGRLAVLAQTSLVDGDSVISVSRSVIRLDASLSMTAQVQVEQPAAVAFSQSTAAFDALSNLLVATQLTASNGATTTIAEIWPAGLESLANVFDVPDSIERPTILSASGGIGFELMFSGLSESIERLHLVSISAEGAIASGSISVSQPLSPTAELGDFRATRSTIDGSLILTTRERVDGLIRLASARALAGPVIVPSPVRNLGVTVVSGSPGAVTAAATLGNALLVRWDPPASDGGSPITSYAVTASPGSSTLIVDPAALSALLTGLDGDTNYSVSVSALNAVGMSTPHLPITVLVPSRPAEGYWMLESSGAVHPFGDATNHGDAATVTAVQLSPTARGNGYWILDQAGRVHAFGDATHHGDLLTTTTTLHDGELPATLAALSDDTGYWIFTTRGRAVNFGAAVHYGDVAHFELSGPVIASVATPSGQGYYQVGSDGGIFANGDAVFRGSVPLVLPGVVLNDPVVGISPTPDNDGYWLVAADGGVFAFGDAPFRGSIPQILPGTTLAGPINGMVAYGDGYLLVASDGGVFTFSDLSFLGSLGATTLDNPIVAIAPISR
jgi:hypothetical protein